MSKPTDTAKKLEKIVKIGQKYGLKSVEVSENMIKIEFNEAIPAKRAPKLTKEQKDALERERERLVMDEMQILDPAAYEEYLAATSNGLKEI